MPTPTAPSANAPGRSSCPRGGRRGAWTSDATAAAQHPPTATTRAAPCSPCAATTRRSTGPRSGSPAGSRSGSWRWRGPDGRVRPRTPEAAATVGATGRRRGSQLRSVSTTNPPRTTVGPGAPRRRQWRVPRPRAPQVQPHRRRVEAMAPQPTPAAATMGAVNTLVCGPPAADPPR